MKIAFAASEMVPFAKTGGLADVIGALPPEVQKLGHETAVFIPKYKTIETEQWNLRTVIDRMDIPFGAEKETGRIFGLRLDSGVQVYFVDHPGFFHRDYFYGTPLGDYPDNDRRFIFFQRAVLETLQGAGFQPDILHCHDWQTGLIPVYLKTLYAGERFFQKMKSVFTVHNLGYQGNFPPDSLPATGIGWEHFKMERLEFYGKISFLKGGLVYSDLLTTVSERYALEIQTKEFGAGMEGVLARRRENLSGVVNGLDPGEWNPETNPDILPFSSKNPEKKAANKAALQKENGFSADPEVPLAGVVTRLVDQKGIDLLIPALGPLMQLGFQFVLLGTGEEKYHQILRDISKKYKGRTAVHILFDAKMAARIYAGADMMFFPSYYEPCGLGQLIALRFGAIPAARATGGLADTIREFNPATGEGNGFLFQDYSAEALLGAADRALKVFQDRKSWRQLVHNAMTSDYSWTASAKKYENLYASAKRRPLEGIEK